ncbi:hypothetical protein V8E51_002660 [Hyaloscypha variabilis]
MTDSKTAVPAPAAAASNPKPAPIVVPLAQKKASGTSIPPPANVKPASKAATLSVSGAAPPLTPSKSTPAPKPAPPKVATVAPKQAPATKTPAATLSGADKAIKAIDDGTKIIQKVGGLMNALGSLFGDDDDKSKVPNTTTKSTPTAPTPAKPVTPAAKPPATAMKPSLKPATSTSAASTTKKVPAAAKPQISNLAATKSAAQTPKAHAAAPSHPASTPHTAIPVHPQITSRDISEPGAALAASSVSQDSFYPGNDTYDKYGNPIQRSNTFGQNNEEVSGGPGDYPAQGLGGDDDASQNPQEDEVFGDQEQRGDNFGNGDDSSAQTDEYGDPSGENDQGNETNTLGERDVNDDTDAPAPAAEDNPTDNDTPFVSETGVNDDNQDQGQGQDDTFQAPADDPQDGSAAGGGATDDFNQGAGDESPDQQGSYSNEGQGDGFEDPQAPQDPVYNGQNQEEDGQGQGEGDADVNGQVLGDEGQMEGQDQGGDDSE